MKSLSHVQLLATPWTAAHQAPPSMEFSRQEYWSGVPLPSPLISLALLLSMLPCMYVYVGMLVDVPENCEVLFFFFISVPQIVYNFS